jgi:selT/selW/selH-like putative selenoprotein
MDRIENELKGDVTLKPSGGGVFEVMANGRLVFSKKESGCFPNEDKLVDELKNG